MVDTPSRPRVGVSGPPDEIDAAIAATAPMTRRDEPARELSPAERRTEMLVDESTILRALFDAEQNKQDLHAVFNVRRPAPTADDPRARATILSFPIKPSDPKVLEALENENTTWERNQSSGLRRVKDFNEPRFHRQVIAAHTIPTVPKAGGGMETIWEVYARAKGLFQPWEAVDRVLLHGEVRSAIRELENLSGFNLTEIEVDPAVEGTAKN